MKGLSSLVLCSAAWLVLWALPDRSFGGYLGCLAMAWTGFALAWRDSATWSPRRLLWLLWGGAVVFRLCGWVGAPVFENDWARFLWDGWRVSIGADPYLGAPQEWFVDSAVPSAMQPALDSMNHPHLRTIYGPVCQAVFGLAASFATGSLLWLKSLLLIADLLVIGVLVWMVGSRRALLYAWCPLVIQETAFSAHPDVLAILPLVTSWHLMQRASARRFIAAGALAAIALMARPHVGLALPFLLWKAGWRGTMAFVITLCAWYLPQWLAAGHLGEWSALGQMAGDWHFNDIALSHLALILNESVAKLICAGVITLTAVVVWLRWHRAERPRIGLLYGVWWLFSPVANPWYLLHAVPWLSAGPGSPVAWSLIVTSGLSYGNGLQLGGNLAPYELAWWVMPAQALAAAAAALWWRIRKAS